MDFEIFYGSALERYFYWKFATEKCYTRMGDWWNRKGENEINLVCGDEDRKPTLTIREKVCELGMRTMREDDIRNVLDSITTVAEVLRYT